jgi:7-cyano-7-deazaguanine synthase
MPRAVGWSLQCGLESVKKQPSAVVLLSGGLDSATALALAVREGFSCHALSFDYGQRHRFELGAARRVAGALGAVEHRVVGIDLRAIGGSALTGDAAVPKGDAQREIGAGIPVTYVPARNLVFLSVAAGYAEVVNARDIFIGVNAVDYSGYPDCRPEFIESIERTVNLGTKAGVEAAARGEGPWLRVRAPLSGMSKAEIIRLGVSMGVDYSVTHSCYDPSEDGAACGRCDSCVIRRRGFAEAGAEDVTRYGER